MQRSTMLRMLPSSWLTSMRTALVLLLGAALLTRAVTHAMSFDPGFAIEDDLLAFRAGQRLAELADPVRPAPGLAWRDAAAGVVGHGRQGEPGMPDDAEVGLLLKTLDERGFGWLPEDDFVGFAVEFRAPDPAANPYLAFAAMLMAGLDGIQKKIEPPAGQHALPGARRLRPRTPGRGLASRAPSLRRRGQPLRGDSDSQPT